MMLLARRNTLGHPRLGVAIGRGAVPNAVARNRLKRAIRESFRHRQAYVGALDVVVWVRKGFKEMAPGELRETLSACWRDLSDKCAGS
jgi:ribonuclease P protein component